MQIDGITIDWEQLGWGGVTVIFVAAVAWERMQAGLKRVDKKLDEKLAEFKEELTKFTLSLKEIRKETAHNREQCEERCNRTIADVRSSTKRAHQRLDEHIEKRGPGGSGGELRQTEAVKI